MRSEDAATVEEQTMAVFSRVNPTCREYSAVDPEFQGLRRREETILANLGLSPEDFAGRRVLDAGCGTGELAQLAASWGAEVWAFDLNPVSVEHAIEMSTRSGLAGRCRFTVGSVLAPPVEGPFDIVMCLGVLAHVGDPRAAYGELAKLVRPGGDLYASHINRYGFALRGFKRAIARWLARGDPARTAAWSKRVWRRHVERAARFGHRTVDQIAWDNFVAPHVTATIADWLEWMKENGLEYVSSFPSFYSLRIPSAQDGGVERMEPPPLPRSRFLQKKLPALAQIRWALAFGVGGLASISFLARKRAVARRCEGDARCG
ncbi:MAG: methyltransferase domain-containing protein [Acidobacteria bacterium]|nr:methyltransferase domain-containing protein [Acidobacteriota bacterium]